jgi:polyhydroxyalkanoate synthesis regulator phasin
MSLPPEDPTRPLAPVGAPPVAAPPPLVGVRERVVVPDDSAFRQMVLDRLDSLRTGLAVVAVLSLLALALAGWTLLREHQDRTARPRGGASSAQIQSLRNRVQDLDSRIGDAAAKADVADLARRVDDLAGKATAKPAPASGSDTQARQSLDQLNQTVTTLNQSVTDLDKRVRTLEDQAQQSP